MREYLWNFSLLVEGVDDLVDVLLAQAVLVAVLQKALAEASIMKMPLRACGVLLVEHDDAGRNAGAVEEVRRQADDALDVPSADDFPADVGFGIATEEHAVRQNDRALAGALE